MKYGVLHIGKYYPPHMGGIEIYLQQLVSYQSKMIDVAAIVANNLRRTQVEFLDGAKITRVASLGVIASMPITPTMAWHIHQHQADLIHLHSPNPGAALAILMSRHSGRLVITHHADTLERKQLRQLSDPLVRRVMERAAAIIVTSRRYLETSEELAPFRDKCKIISLGIDPSSLKEGDASVSKNIREKYGERLLLAVGRLVAYKGLEYLIQSMRDVNGVLLLVGTGPLEDELRSCIQEHGVQKKVFMLGHVDEVAAYYNAAKIFVMPSITRAEAFGVVQMEAMAAGLPVINTNIPSGVPEVSLHGKTGLTVPPRDPKALADAINVLLDNVEFRQTLGDAARERIQKEFSVEKMVAQTMSLYRGLKTEWP